MTPESLADLSLAHLTRLKADFAQRTSTMIAMAETYRIELVSILVLFYLLSLILFYINTSTLPRKEFSNMASSADIGEGGIQEKFYMDSGAGHRPGYAETEHHVITKVSDGSLHVLEIRHFTEEPEVSEEVIKGSWEPRLLGRERKATRRFEESWNNERLRRLGSALSVSL